MFLTKIARRRALKNCSAASAAISTAASFANHFWFSFASNFGTKFQVSKISKCLTFTVQNCRGFSQGFFSSDSHRFAIFVVLLMGNVSFMSYK